MKRYLKIYLVAIKNHVASRLAYRVDFFMGMIITIASELLLPLLTALIYRSGTAFPGWSYHEALLLQGIFITFRGASYALFFGMTGTVMSNVREGTFDLIMIRPAPAVFLSVAISFSLDDVGVFLSGVAIFIFVAIKVHVILTLTGFAWFVLMFLASITVMFGFTLMMSATMFKWVGNSRIYEIFESIAGFGRYPATIFPGIFRVLVTFVFPVAVLGSLPAAVFLGKQSADPVQLMLLILSCGGFLVFGYIIWRVMIRSYISSGG